MVSEGVTVWCREFYYLQARCKTSLHISGFHSVLPRKSPFFSAIILLACLYIFPGFIMSLILTAVTDTATLQGQLQIWPVVQAGKQA